MMRRIAALLIGLIAVCAYAQTWSAFTPVGDGVSVSFARANNNTYTWRFRNDGDTTITYMEFSYTYTDAGTHRIETRKDVLPGSLRPGQGIGGWAAFTATTRQQPSIEILKIKRQ